MCCRRRSRCRRRDDLDGRLSNTEKRERRTDMSVYPPPPSVWNSYNLAMESLPYSYNVFYVLLLVPSSLVFIYFESIYPFFMVCVCVHDSCFFFDFIPPRPVRCCDLSKAFQTLTSGTTPNDKKATFHS